MIPVLGEQAGTCGEQFKSPGWYHCPPLEPGCAPGYKVPGAWGISYRDYVISVVTRYKDDATIAFWQLMNEAFVDGAATDPGALADFAADMVQAIRLEAGDTNHLVSLGTVGANAMTQSQLEPVRRLMDCPSPCMDVASAHYYGSEALQGMPAQTTLAAQIVADPASANPRALKTDIEGRTLQVDGWRTVQATVYNPQTQDSPIRGRGESGSTARRRRGGRCKSTGCRS